VPDLTAGAELGLNLRPVAVAEGNGGGCDDGGVGLVLLAGCGGTSAASGRLPLPVALLSGCWDGAPPRTVALIGLVLRVWRELNRNGLLAVCPAEEGAAEGGG
jgi:hypothetical protein